MKPKFDDLTVDDTTRWQDEQHQTYITVKKVKDRTLRSSVRFYGSLAGKHGVRLSALVYHVVGWLKKKLKNNPGAYEYDPCWKFGKALGVGPKQVYRLLHKAKAAGLLDYRKGLNETQVWLTQQSLLQISADDVFYYDRDVANRLTRIDGDDRPSRIGINGSILYAQIYYHTAHPDEEGRRGYFGGCARFRAKFPWMTKAIVKFTLHRLRGRGLIDWDKDGCYPGSFHFFVPKLLEAPAGESTPNTIRRSFGLSPDAVPLAPRVLQGHPAPGRKNDSLQVPLTGGKPYCNRAAEQDAAGLEKR
jgi:hypothetical protein